MSYSSRFGAFIRPYLRPPPLIPTTIHTIQFLAFINLVTETLIEPRFCVGFSMVPTMDEEAACLVSPLPYWIKTFPLFRASTWTRGDPEPTTADIYNGRGGLFGRNNDAGGGGGGKRPPGAGGPERGDLVVVVNPRDPRITICKRVVGVEGDVIEIEPRRSGGERRWLAEEDRMYSPAHGLDGSSSNSRSKSTSGSTSRSHSSTNAVASSSKMPGNGNGQNAHADADAEVSVDQGEGSRGYITDEHYNRIYSASPTKQIRTHDSEGRPLAYKGMGGGGVGSADWRRAGRRGEDKFVKIPKGYIWLAGDNMSNSTDSREYGPVPVGLVRGKVLARANVSGRDSERQATLRDSELLLGKTWNLGYLLM